MINGAIFDADGTLLDSMSLWKSLGRRYLEARNIKAEAAIDDILYPMTLFESSSYIKSISKSADSTEKITADMLSLIGNDYRCHVKLKDGVEAYLKYLYRLGIPMVIASAGDRALLTAAFKRLHILGYFRDILTCDKTGLSKSDGGLYLAAAQLIGTSPELTAVFEDAPYCVLAAKKAGFVTVAVEDISSTSSQFIIKSTADFYIKSFADPILKNI